MNRRFFLQLVAAGMSGELADRLLWVPKPMITVPAMPSFRVRWVTDVEPASNFITRFDVLLGLPEFETTYTTYVIGPACLE